MQRQRGNAPCPGTTMPRRLPATGRRGGQPSSPVCPSHEAMHTRATWDVSEKPAKKTEPTDAWLLSESSPADPAHIRVMNSDMQDILRAGQLHLQRGL